MLVNLSFQKATASYLALLPLGTYNTRLVPGTLLGKVVRNTFGGSFVYFLVKFCSKFS